MSAIKPHLEQQDDPSETKEERKYSSQSTFVDKIEASEGGSGLGDVYPLPLKAHEALQTAHSELLRLGYTRRASLGQLAERNFTVERKVRKDGTGEIILVLDAAITGPEWNRASAGNMRNFDLLSWTQKMGTPSFSLPAGAPHVGGTCPGATGGQSIVPSESLLRGQKHVTKVTGMPVLLPDATCERCYATGGNYAYGSMVAAQALRAIWTKAALNDGTFVDLMSWAVDHADYMLEGGTIKTGKTKTGEPKSISYDPERFPGRYFRIHDSGDFFNRKYLEAWKEVANNFKSGKSRITFWAPSRIWATDWGVEAVNDINSDEDSNLIIRPSTYHINEAAPKSLGDGWSAWSECWAKGVKDRLLTFPHRSSPGQSGRAESSDIPVPFDWDCQAYAVVDEAHSCRNARGPVTHKKTKSDIGCRACWVGTKSTVNYTEH
jgi:hypothetical protein